MQWDRRLTSYSPPPIAFKKCSAICYAVVVQGNTLYVQQQTEIDVYAEAGTFRGSFPSETRVIDAEVPLSFSYALAIGRTNLYAATGNMFPSPVYVVVDKDSSGQVRAKRFLVGTDCYQGGSNGALSYGLVERQGLLYQTCETPGGLFIYDADGAHKLKPLWSLISGTAIDGVAFGP